MSDPDEQHIRIRPPYGEWKARAWFFYGVIDFAGLAAIAWAWWGK